MTAPTITLDHRALAAEFHSTDRTGDADKCDKAAMRFHENLHDGTYDVDNMRAFWRTYRDAMYAESDAHKRRVFAAMMVATEDAVKAYLDEKFDPAVIGPKVEQAVQTATQSHAAIKSIPAGYYAITREDEVNAFDFFKVDVPERGKWAGFRFVVQVIGDHHKRLDRRAQTTALMAIAADVRQAAIDYGHEIGRCSVCNRRLTDPESIDAGIGPVCAGKRGW